MNPMSEFSSNLNNANIGLGDASERMIPHFKIPVRKEMLCDENQMDPTQFFVQEKIDILRVDEDDIFAQLEQVSQRICGQG